LEAGSGTTPVFLFSPCWKEIVNWR
jgi:hypothetical protein